MVRPRSSEALSLAFNGASVGGIVFVPLWVALIDVLGFPASAGLVGITMVLVVGTLAARFLRKGPRDFGLNVDGDVVAPSFPKSAPTLTRAALMRDRRFITISAAFALGLFADRAIERPFEVSGDLLHLRTSFSAAFGRAIGHVLGLVDCPAELVGCLVFEIRHLVGRASVPWACGLLRWYLWRSGAPSRR
jgi:hypothetical protein